MIQKLPEHSPLGASSAERWMNCPGSVGLLRDLELPDTDEPEYRKEGQAMHTLGECCLKENRDAWEFIGEELYDDTKIDSEMALAVQEYVDFAREAAVGATEIWIERRLSSPDHPLMYGRLDFAAVFPWLLHVIDLKGGKGVIVEPEDNPQEKYYAYLLIREHPEWAQDMPVQLSIAQTRAFHHGGHIRSWETTVGEIREWVKDYLLPAMYATEYDNELDAGDWCRFCPAKLVCPLMTSLFGAAANYNKDEVITLNDQSLGRSYQKLDAVKHYTRALQDEVLRRSLAGHVPPGVKVVNKRANRVLNEGAADLAKAKWGSEAMEPVSVKSPPELEKLPGGRDFVAEHAHTPNTGYTVALESDPRPAVIIKTASETFTVRQLENE